MMDAKKTGISRHVEILQIRGVGDSKIFKMMKVHLEGVVDRCNTNLRQMMQNLKS